MSTAQQSHEAAEEDLKLWLAFYTLVDIFLMFAGLIVMNTTAWWIRVPYHIAAILLAIFVMRLAYIAARYVPESIPFQRQIGIFLYLSCHSIQFFRWGELPIAMAGYLMAAGPLGIWFLFDHLLDD